jgi:hypothetical protein
MSVNGAQCRLSVVKKQKRDFDKENFNPEKPTEMKSENGISVVSWPRSLLGRGQDTSA